MTNQAQTNSGKLYLHYSFVFDVEGTASDAPVCSSERTGLSSFASNDEAERTPLRICRGFDDNQNGCTINSNLGCTFTATSKCYWDQDPEYLGDPTLSNTKVDDDEIDFGGMDETGGSSGADPSVSVSAQLDLSMIQEITLYSGRLPQSGQSSIEVQGIECGIQSYLHCDGSAESAICNLDITKYWDIDNVDSNKKDLDAITVEGTTGSVVLEKHWIPPTFGSWGYLGGEAWSAALQQILDTQLTSNKLNFGDMNLEVPSANDVADGMLKMLGRGKPAEPSAVEVFAQRVLAINVMALHFTMHFGYGHHQWIFPGSGCLVEITKGAQPFPVFFEVPGMSLSSIGLGHFLVGDASKNPDLTGVIAKWSATNNQAGLHVCRMKNIGRCNADVDMSNGVQLAAGGALYVVDVLKVDHGSGCTESSSVMSSGEGDPGIHAVWNGLDVMGRDDLCEEACVRYKWYGFSTDGKCRCRDEDVAASGNATVSGTASQNRYYKGCLALPSTGTYDVGKLTRTSCPAECLKLGHVAYAWSTVKQCHCIPTSLLDTWPGIGVELGEAGCVDIWFNPMGTLPSRRRMQGTTNLAELAPVWDTFAKIDCDYVKWSGESKSVMAYDVCYGTPRKGTQFRCSAGEPVIMKYASAMDCLKGHNPTEHVPTTISATVVMECSFGKHCSSEAFHSIPPEQIALGTPSKPTGSIRDCNYLESDSEAEGPNLFWLFDKCYHDTFDPSYKAFKYTCTPADETWSRLEYTTASDCYSGASAANTVVGGPSSDIFIDRAYCSTGQPHCTADDFLGATAIPQEVGHLAPTLLHCSYIETYVTAAMVLFQTYRSVNHPSCSGTAGHQSNTEWCNADGVAGTTAFSTLAECCDTSSADLQGMHSTVYDYYHVSGTVGVPTKIHHCAASQSACVAADFVDLPMDASAGALMPDNCADQEASVSPPGESQTGGTDTTPPPPSPVVHTIGFPKLKQSVIPNYGGKSDIWIKVGPAVTAIVANLEYPLYFFTAKKFKTFNQWTAGPPQTQFASHRNTAYFKGRYAQIGNRGFIIRSMTTITLRGSELTALTDGQWLCITCMSGRGLASLGYASVLYYVVPDAITELYISQIAGDTTLPFDVSTKSRTEMVSALETSFNGIKQSNTFQGMYLRKNSMFTSVSTRKCWLFGKKPESLGSVTESVKIPPFGTKETMEEAQDSDSKFSAVISMKDIKVIPFEYKDGFNLEFIPTVGISYDLGIVPVSMDLNFYKMTYFVPGEPCNTVYSPPESGVNRPACCGYEGPEFCICFEVECIEKCKGRGGGTFQCDPENEETTGTQCQCRVSEGLAKIIFYCILGGMALIVLACFGLTFYCGYRYLGRRWARNDANGANQNANGPPAAGIPPPPPIPQNLPPPPPIPQQANLPQNGPQAVSEWDGIPVAANADGTWDDYPDLPPMPTAEEMAEYDRQYDEEIRKAHDRLRNLPPVPEGYFEQFPDMTLSPEKIARLKRKYGDGSVLDDTPRDYF